AVLYHHVLRLCRGVLLVHCAAVALARAVRLRRAALGHDDVAVGRLFHGGDDPRGSTAGESSGRALVGRKRVGDHGRRDLRLVAGLTPRNEQTREFLRQGRELYRQRTGDPTWSTFMGLQSLDNLRQQQAAAFGFFDVFFVCAVLSIVLVVLVLPMRRSVAEKG